MVISLLIACCSFLVLQRDTGSTLDTASAGIVQPDSLEQLVEQFEDVEESDILDVLEETYVPASPTTFIDSRSRAVRKLQPSRGYADGRYTGSSTKTYQRLKLTSGGHLAGGFLVEKDAGESKLSDFTSGYLLTRNLGPIQSVVLGDYIVEAGQGIALWRGYDFTKGAEVVLPARRKGRGLVPYASSDENSFLRGAATQLVWEDITLLAFYSRKSLSATLDTSGNVSSLYAAGLFRTSTEKEKRNNLSETMVGFHSSYSFSRKNRIGITGYTASFSREFATGRLTGRSFRVLSSNYELAYESVHMFGEWSLNNAKVGGISGLQVMPAKQFDFITVVRIYPSGMLNVHANGFGERLGTTNEHGWYIGVHIRPVQRLRLSVYYDLFSFPEKSSTTLFGGGGHEIFFQADITAAPKLLITPRLLSKVTVERKSIVDEYNRTIRFDDDKRKNNYRVTVDYRLNKLTTVRSRFEYTEIEFHYLKRREHGFLVYSDIVTKLSGTLTINGRVAVYRTDSFDSGIGEYERDLPGVLTVPILYGRGVKWYFLLQYSLMESLRLSFKYSELIRDDVKTIGSGLDEIMTNRDNRFGVQVDVSL
jgi:hypothetical protein